MADKTSRARALIVPVLFALALTAAALAAQQAQAPARGQGRGQAGPPADPLADGDYTIRPAWSNANELIWDNSIKHGTVYRFDMKSEDSKIYKGLPARAPRGGGRGAAGAAPGAPGAPAAPNAPSAP